MPQLTGILETCLYVDDLERAAAFYESLFGFPRIFQNERLTALGVESKQVLLLFKKGASASLPVSAHDGSGQSHVAFAIAGGELAAWDKFLAERGIPIEERKTWPRGGTSLYFRDPDGHLLELATPGVWSIY